MAASPNFRKTAHSNRSISFAAAAMLLGTWLLLNFQSKFGPDKRVMAGGPALTSDSDTVAANAVQKNLTIKQKINEQIQDNKQYLQKETLGSLIETGPVKSIWGLFWRTVFSRQYIHDALLKLLVNTIHEKQFVDKSADFGLEWIGHCVQSKKVVDEAVVLSEKTFVRDQDVVDAAQEFCIWYVRQPRVSHEVCKIIEQVTCWRNDSNDIMCWQIGASVCNTLYSPVMFRFFQEAFEDVMSRESVQEAMMDGMKAECKDRVSLGTYNLIFANTKRLEEVGKQLNESIETVRGQKPLVHCS